MEGRRPLTDSADIVERADGSPNGDPWLVDRARRGDRSAKRALFQRHAPAVASLLRRTFGRDVDVRDGVQQTFLVAFRELERLREPAAFRVWLLRIALRSGRQLWWTHRVRELLVPKGAEEDPLWDASEVRSDLSPDDRAELVLLGRRLGRLPIALRHAVVVRHAFGHTLEETATICGCSLATINRRLAEAEKRLRGETS
jgi:RNA polymerase sigma-70 factor (ECF subfamily)